MREQATTRTAKAANAGRIRCLIAEYVAPLLAALGLTLALTWPLPLYFSRSLIGEGDVAGSLGTLWYWQQFLLGHEPLYFASRLYYPHGITLVTNSIGPFSALFALPFWGLGPAAAYNAAIVVGFTLTGFCMYLLARAIDCSRPAAWLAGLLYMLAPLHLLAVYGHVNKVFLGFIPLALLVSYRALATTPARADVYVGACTPSAEAEKQNGRAQAMQGWWAAALGPMLVLAFLQAPEQFVIAGLGCGLLAIYRLLTAEPAEWKPLLRRTLGMAISAGACAALLFVLVSRAAEQTGVIAAVGAESNLFQPDLLQFFIPNGFGLIPLGRTLNALLTPEVNTIIETAVYLTWTGIVLCMVAFWQARGRAAVWLIMLGVAMLMALGPTLRVMGDSWLTQRQVPLPYAWLNILPGFNLMRTPGRFMLLGEVGLAAAAAIGVDQVRRMLKPAYAMAFVALVAALVMLETWVDRYPDQPLLPVPPFYQKIAEDKEMYGVLDLPIRPGQEIGYANWHVYFSSFYQVDQITHGKGIATGYVSRFYPIHPVFGQFISENFSAISPLQGDMTIDGEPSSRYANLRYDLAENNYRYVVLHKPRAEHPVYKPGAWGEQAAQRLIDDVFGNERPLVDDTLTTVYTVGPLPAVSTLQPSLALLEPAAKMEYGEHRWTTSPAQLLVHSPQPLLTHLEVTLRGMQSDRQYARLSVESGDGDVVASRSIAPLEATRIPIALAPGSQVITLTLTATGGHDGDEAPDKIAFVIGQIDMATAPDADAAIPIADDVLAGTQAAYGEGWYAAETDSEGTNTWRWAASPATLWIYAPQTQTVTLRTTPVALHAAGSPDGKGNSGSLAVSLNGQALRETPVTVGAPFAIPLEAPPGWSQVTLALAAGNFKPIDVQPATGDGRVLSFALQDLEIGQ